MSNSTKTGFRSRVLFATRNMNKFKEAFLILSKYNIQLDHLPEDKLEIQSDSLEEIATYAVKELASRYPNRNLLVEDDGLFIEALKGFPGPFSSYVYRTIGLSGILKLMSGRSDRRAYFKSVVAFVSPELGLKVFTGVVSGVIAEQEKGSQGFGYDPIFIPEGSSKTFAEMDIKEKNLYSHRGRAFTKFAEWFRNVMLV